VATGVPNTHIDVLSGLALPRLARDSTQTLLLGRAKPTVPEGLPVVQREVIVMITTQLLLEPNDFDGEVIQGLPGGIGVLRPHTILARIPEAGVSTRSVAGRRPNEGGADGDAVEVHLGVYQASVEDLRSLTEAEGHRKTHSEHTGGYRACRGRRDRSSGHPER
jgi:hypothetical protein